MMIYPIGRSGQRLLFSKSVLAHMLQHRQLRLSSREAGGQLFGRFIANDVVIEEATGPRRSDRRTRHSYHPDRIAEQAEIEKRHAQGFTFVGDWHTHPEAMPSPSGSDLGSMHEMFQRSVHRLNAFVLVIVGTEPLPRGIYVAVTNAKEAIKLEAAST